MAKRKGGRSAGSALHRFGRSQWFYTATAVAGGLGIWAAATAIFTAATQSQINAQRMQTRGQRHIGG